jgi:hypothetical protein
MTLTNPQKTILHVAKAKTNLSDAGYRSALAQIAGVTSSTELDRAGFEAMMGYFDYLGFRPKEAKGASYGERLGMASWAQIELIRTLWTEITGGAYDGEAELNKWLLRSFKVSSLRFLKKEAAPKVITALKAWKARPKAA